MTEPEASEVEVVPTPTEVRPPWDVRFWALIVTLVLIALAAMTWVSANLRDATKEDLLSFGPFGDYFGGMLNPLLTFLTFLALLITLTLQRKEMVESRVQFTRSADALAKQNVQSSFYQLLSIHNQIIEGMSVVDPATKERVHGREVFRVIYSDLRRDYRSRVSKQASVSASRRLDDKTLIIRSYNVTYQKHQENLSHYFRYLYNTLLLLTKTNADERFIKVLRALLSDQELLVLYYNVTVSDPGLNFQPLAIDHRLFDNMPPHLLEDEHADYIAAEAFGAQNYASKRAALLRHGPPEEVPSTVLEHKPQTKPAAQRPEPRKSAPTRSRTVEKDRVRPPRKPRV